MDRTRRIDIHAHIVDRTYMAELRALLQLEGEPTGDGAILYRRNGTTVAWTREDMFDIPFRIGEMNRKGIDVRVLSLSTPNVYDWRGAAQVDVARRINDALAAVCRDHPERFVGLASLPLDDVDASLAELERATGELGMKGLIIGSNIDGVALNDARYEPLWARIDALRLPVFEHPMFPKDTSDLREFELPLRVGLIFETTLVATRLIYGGVFERYPNFPYIMAHTGGALLMLLERLDNGYRLFPDCRKFISELPSVYARRLYYDTAAFGKAALMLALDTVGAEHLLLGTDDPFINSDLTHVERLNLESAAQDAILGGNAARLLGL
jgi:aminocarboxymuconate-semialdehyde decarboxylase